jgi:hypothetical protein
LGTAQETISVALGAYNGQQFLTTVLSSHESWLGFAFFRSQLPGLRYRRLAPIMKNYP